MTPFEKERVTVSKPVYITCDSTCDLPPALLERFQIRFAPLTITLGEENFLDDGSFTTQQLYARFREDGTLPQTAAVSPQAFMDFFRPLLEEGYEIVHIDLSSELSSTYQNACLAAMELEDVGAVHVVDSRHLTASAGLLALHGADLRDQGVCAADIAARLREMTARLDTSFVLDTLDYMWKGGRCSGIAALGANLLKLKPCLEMRDGALVVCKKYRGSIEKVYRQYIAERLSGKEVAADYVFLAHSGQVDEALLEELTALVKELTCAREIFLIQAGCTISSHCGPKTLGVLFLRKA
ncbi:MAG: DegV family protein [Ruminococcaceae bacterium]|nr:DegV family protein [Oscillospiraceae bacterium]